jgi:hypothetical protein
MDTSDFTDAQWEQLRSQVATRNVKRAVMPGRL